MLPAAPGLTDLPGLPDTARMGERIPEITEADLQPPRLAQEIYPNQEHTLYWSYWWKPEWYVALARAGFISTSHVVQGMDLLLPELQKEYAVLDWQNRRRLPAIRRMLKRGELVAGGYTIKLSGAPEAVAAVIAGIQAAYGESCWLSHTYCWLMLQLAAMGATVNPGTGNGARAEFQLVATALHHGDGTLLAGELGYTIGAIYTSLTGFLDRRDPRHRNLGKVQLASLGSLLERNGYAFWNLGHPHMAYKIELGAVKLPRAAFLERWQAGILKNPAVPLTAEPSCHTVADLLG